MIRLLRFHDYQVMPWKNGRGTTAQIAIHPKDADFSGDDFLWRASSAKVSQSGPFSAFPGCDRLLVVWQGAGLLVGGQFLAPRVPLKFSGTEVLEAQLVEGPVVDLGVIYRRGRVTADMRLETIAAGAGHLSLSLGEGTHLLFCAEGSIEADGARASPGDTLRVDGPAVLELKSATGEATRIFRISLA